MQYWVGGALNRCCKWVYGGGFATGDASSYNGSTIVQRSVELGEPVIYVNFNYRLNGFGFLGGKEALAGGAANIGIYDRACYLDRRTFVASDNYFYRFSRSLQLMHRWFTGYTEKFFLDWVKTYISRFGGDPNQITV